MKRIISVFMAVLMLLSVLASCTAEESISVAVPGVAELYVSSSDSSIIPGYSANVEVKDEISALALVRYSSDKREETKAFILGGNTYQTTYDCTRSLMMRRKEHDCYIYKDDETNRITEFYAVNDKLIGYLKRGAYADASVELSKTEKDLVEIAKSALEEFTDIAYYANIKITSSEPDSYYVYFYNMIGDVEVADSSYVRLLSDGTVIEVFAAPEPDILEVARFSELDAKKFDSAIEMRIKEAYADYLCDNEEMYVRVIFSGIKVESRMLSLDDEGNPVVLYFLMPQLDYEYTYRGEMAKLAEERGVDVSESGISAPPVYATVRIENN